MSSLQMRAVLVKNEKGPIENLYIGDVTKPVPGAGQVLVKIKAFGLNRMDIMQREGHYPPPAGSSQILGVEFSGHIAEIGPDVNGWCEGDEVMGLAGGGAYAEYVVLPYKNVIKKPTHLSWVQAASILETFLTAFQALVVLGDLKAGEDVLIHAGASGLGVAACQIARMYGAKTVTVTTSTEAKANCVLSIPNGATHAVNYKTQDFSKEVKTITANKGVDVLIDVVGQSHWHKNMESLAVDGRMTILAFLSGQVVPSVDLAPILFKRLRIQGSTLRSRSPEYQSILIARFAQEVLGKFTGSGGNGPLYTYIHKVYPWTDIQAAHRDMEEDKNSGKIVVEVV